MRDSTRDYVLLTAACNEESYIAGTISSVLHQTILPQRWVIVSDGSTDRTDDIVKYHAERNGFITFVRREKTGGRDFSAKGLALQEGFRLLADIDYSFYCTLDADVSFDKAYFQTILEKFRVNPNLGIAAGIILEYRHNRLHNRIASLSSVTGAVQCIRRECLQSSYSSIVTELGGEDSIVEIKAKKSGWTVQSFPELPIHHHRATGSAGMAQLKGKYRYGITDYRLGNPMFFEFFKCCRRIFEPPYLLAGLAIFWGYAFSFFTRPPKLLSADELAFVKRMQADKIIAFFRRMARIGLSPRHCPSRSVHENMD